MVETKIEMTIGAGKGVHAKTDGLGHVRMLYTTADDS